MQIIYSFPMQTSRLLQQLQAYQIKDALGAETDLRGLVSGCVNIFWSVSTCSVQMSPSITEGEFIAP